MNIKKFFIITTIFITSAIFVFADGIPFITFSFGLTTGHSFYGSDYIEYTFKTPSELLNNTNTDPELQAAGLEETDTENQDSSENDSPIENEETDESDNNEEEQNEYTTINIPTKFINGNEILIGATAAVNFNITDIFTVFTDLDFLSDLNWHNKDYSHHLDYSVSSGVKLYVIPSIPAISFSIAYLFGQRTDIFKYEEYKATKNTSWGNGIKLAAEYNFSRDGFTTLAPVVGCSWRHIPRGNHTSDNIISAYAQISF